MRRGGRRGRERWLDTNGGAAAGRRMMRVRPPGRRGAEGPPEQRIGAKARLWVGNGGRCNIPSQFTAGYPFTATSLCFLILYPGGSLHLILFFFSQTTILIKRRSLLWKIQFAEVNRLFAHNRSKRCTGSSPICPLHGCWERRRSGEFLVSRLLVSVLACSR